MQTQGSQNPGAFLVRQVFPSVSWILGKLKWLKKGKKDGLRVCNRNRKWEKCISDGILKPFNTCCAFINSTSYETMLIVLRKIHVMSCSQKSTTYCRCFFKQTRSTLSTGISLETEFLHHSKQQNTTYAQIAGCSPPPKKAKTLAKCAPNKNLKRLWTASES